jgi:hypothetical protein
VPGDPDYSKFLDINGDGRINTPDWRISRAEGGNRLPPGEPGPAGPSPLASATGVMANDLVLAGPLDPAPVRLDSMASRTGLSAWDEALLMVAAEDLDRADDKEEAASELLPALFFDFGQE